MDIRLVTLGIALQFVGIASYNTDTSSYSVLKGPRENSFFGYSVAVARINGSVEIWSGSPKYGADGEAGGVKEGAIYRCKVTETSNARDLEQSCQKLRLKTTADKNADKKNETGKPSPEKAFDCVFENSACGFTFDHEKWWLLRRPYNQRNVQRVRKNFRSHIHEGLCFNGIRPKTRLTGPPAFTVHGGIIVMNSARAIAVAYKNRKYVSKTTRVKTSMATKSVEAKRGSTHCLRFCYNAYSVLDNNKETRRDRSIRVFLRYNDSTTRDVFMYRGLYENASRYWNFTEIDIKHEKDASYKVLFEIGLAIPYTELCAVASDIAFADISVTKSPCEEEPEEIDVLDGEQSVGMSLSLDVGEEGQTALSACGSLWQQNCGFAKEAAGICYEVKDDGSEPTVVRNPGLKGCIRGKIDVVLLVDQSGSVNHCNFQKVKAWLRNTVRGFAIGPEQQDIGIVVFSNNDTTSDVFSLGFQKYGNSGNEKKHEMLQQLRKLSYQAGQTFTGVAFQHANDMLWGPNGRRDAKKMVILLTDGATTDEDRENLHKQVSLMRQRDGIVLSVGVANYNKSELKGISGSEEYVFVVDDFSQLGDVRNTLRQTVHHTQLEGTRRSTSMQNCQMGFSLHSDKDAMLMGSPGCFARVGNVIRFAKQTNHSDEDINEGSAMNNFSFSTVFPIADSFGTTQAVDYAIATSKADHSGQMTYDPDDERSPLPGLIEIPTLADLEHALRNQLDESYLGYAVTSGNFFGEVEGSYVAASAPRHLGSGSVLLYKPSQRDLVSNNRVIRGMQLGEYFGAYLCAEDVNSDGYTDLFVGAPLHIGDNSDEGRVYVYMGGNNVSATPDVILEGQGAEFGRFGLVITSVGDVSSDGYNDIVVSAPHEEGGRGAVYVFNGGKEGLTRKYTQRVAASSFSDGDTFRLFGQSVAGGTDFDNNHYPDILVGVPGSDRIVILKTRPVVDVDVRFFVPSSFIDRKNDQCLVKNASALANSDVCIVCVACFSYSSLSPPQAIMIRYKIFPDTAMRKARVRFHSDHDNRREIRREEIVRGANSFACFNHTLYLESNVEDKMTNVTMQLTFEMDERTAAEIEGFSASSSPSTLRPVLDRSNKREFTADVAFKTYCEDTSSCVADISLEQSGPVSENGEAVDVYKIDETRLMRYRLHLTNRGPEEAHAVMVVIRFSTTIQFTSLMKTDCFRPLEIPKTDGPDDGIGVLKIVLENTFLGPEESCDGHINFLLKSHDSIQRIEGVTFLSRAHTVSKDENLLNNERNSTVAVGLKTVFTISGESWPSWISVVIPDDTSNNTKPPFESFDHVYTLFNSGPFAILNFSVRVQWPTCVKDTERSRHVRFVGVTLQRNGGTKSRSDADVISVENTFQNDSTACGAISDKEMNFSAECASTYVTRCPSIVSHVKMIEPNQRINIRLAGEIDPLQYDDLESQAVITTILNVTIHDQRRLIFDEYEILEQSIATSVLPRNLPYAETEEKRLGGYPLWVYILCAVAAGFIILLLVIYLMWRVGCLQSKYANKKREMEENMAGNPESATPINSYA